MYGILIRISAPIRKKNYGTLRVRVVFQPLFNAEDTMRVVAVDDRSAFQGLMAALRVSGAIVDMAGTGHDVLDLLRHYDYDIVIVSSLLVDMDGCEAVRRMRSSKIDTPVLMMCDTNRGQFSVKALSAGADDVMVAPFETAEFLARIQAIIRRSKGFSQPKIAIGNVELDIQSKEVCVNGSRIHLTGKEHAILELLMLRKGMVLTKDAFLNHLYGGMDEPEMKIIDVFICKLRKKLSLAGAGNIIGTVWGRGYTIRDAVSIRATQTQTSSARSTSFLSTEAA